METPLILSLLVLVLGSVCVVLLLRDRASRREQDQQRDQDLKATIDERIASAVESLSDRTESSERVMLEAIRGNSSTVGARVEGMDKNFSRLNELVTNLQRDGAASGAQLKERLDATLSQQRELAESTGAIREVLASSKARGSWGERMAEDVLRAVGMQENINYHRQDTLEGGTKPDFTFMLPHDQLLHMDVKFPLDNYQRFVSADSDNEAERFKRDFLRDVRNRIKEVTGRDYAAADSTVGYLLVFIPNEAVYGFIHEHDADLLDYAMGQSVVLCSPSTLFAVLGVIRQAMDTHSLARATNEILDCLGKFGEQWQKFSDQVDKVERNLKTLDNSFGELAGVRRRQLEKQLAKVDELRSGVAAAEDTPVLGSPSAPVLREVEAG